MKTNLQEALEKAEYGDVLNIRADSKAEARKIAHEIKAEWMARPEALDCECEDHDTKYEVGGWTAETSEEKCVEFRVNITYPEAV